MDKELKKAVMLLKSLILHYHGLDDEEKEILEKVADERDSHEELKWANQFIAEDYLSAFERSKDYFSNTLSKISEHEKLKHLKEVWEENHQKGYVTEMEATAIINLARDWKVDKAFLKIIQN